MEQSTPSQPVNALVMATVFLLGAQEMRNASDDLLALLRQIADRLDETPSDRAEQLHGDNDRPDLTAPLICASTAGAPQVTTAA